jgi:hypothetical protein
LTALGWSGDNCEITLCNPSTFCGDHGQCNSTALQPNQCICDEHWFGARCSASDADVQSLYIISTKGITVANPFAGYAQQVPLKDKSFSVALYTTSRRSIPSMSFRAFNGQLFTIVNDSFYFVNPWTGASQVLELGHQVGSGAVAIGYTSQDKVMYMIRGASLYYFSEQTLYAPVLFGTEGQWSGVTAMTGVSNYQLFIATDKGLILGVYT